MNNHMMHNNMPGGMPNNSNLGSAVKQKSPVELGYFGTCILAILGCFLPFYTVSAFGMTMTVNFIYVEGELARGIFVIAGIILGAILVLKKKEKLATIGNGIAVLILAITFFDFNSSAELSGFGSFQIGFYVIAIGVIGSAVCLGLIIKEKAVPNPVTNFGQPQMNQFNQQPMMNNQMQQPMHNPQTNNNMNQQPMQNPQVNNNMMQQPMQNPQVNNNMMQQPMNNQMGMQQGQNMNPQDPNINRMQ